MVGSGFAIRGFARFCCMVGDRLVIVIIFGTAWLIADGCVGGQRGRRRGVR